MNISTQGFESKKATNMTMCLTFIHVLLNMLFMLTNLFRIQHNSRKCCTIFCKLRIWLRVVSFPASSLSWSTSHFWTSRIQEGYNLRSRTKVNEVYSFRLFCLEYLNIRVQNFIGHGSIWKDKSEILHLLNYHFKNLNISSMYYI